MRKFVISLVALVAIAAGLLLAQQGNQVIPAGSGSFSALQPATNANAGNFVYSQAGVFTNAAASNNSLEVDLNNNPCSYSTFTSTSVLTDAVLGCVTIPTSGVTNAFTNALAGYVLNPNANATGQNGWVGGVGIYTQSVCTGGSASNTRCWGANFSVQDGASLPAKLFGNEYDIVVKNATTSGFGQLMTNAGISWTAQPTFNPLTGPGNFPAFNITPQGATQGSNTWTAGFVCASGATATTSGTNFGDCLDVGPDLSGNSTNSQAVILRALNGSGTGINSEFIETSEGGGHAQLAILGYSAGANDGINSVQFGTPLATGTNTVSGCSLSAALGGRWAGKFASGTAGTCTVTITPGITATNGFSCWANDITTAADVVKQTAFTTTTATISGTTASGDTVTWGCVAF